MTTEVLDRFLPLQSAIAQAESWTRYLKDWPPKSSMQHPEQLFSSSESIVGVGVKVGEMLPLTWRLTFDVFFRFSEETCISVEELEAVRLDMHRLFFTAREAMDATRQVAEALEALTGKKPAQMVRLLQVIDEAVRLQETVFRDWPSFAEPLTSSNPSDSLPVDESLAESLGITVAEARLRMETRRREIPAELG